MVVGSHGAGYPPEVLLGARDLLSVPTHNRGDLSGTAELSLVAGWYGGVGIDACRRELGLSGASHVGIGGIESRLDVDIAEGFHPQGSSPRAEGVSPRHRTVLVIVDGGTRCIHDRDARPDSRPDALARCDRLVLENLGERLLEELLVGIFPTEVEVQGFVLGGVFNHLREVPEIRPVGHVARSDEIGGSCRPSRISTRAIAPVRHIAPSLETGQDCFRLPSEADLHIEAPVAGGLVGKSTGGLAKVGLFHVTF